MNVLAQARSKLSQINASELEVLEDQPALVEIWERIQQLREEMNQVKKAAATEAAKPYLEKIGVLERDYAVLLRLSA